MNELESRFKKIFCHLHIHNSIMDEFLRIWEIRKNDPIKADRFLTAVEQEIGFSDRSVITYPKYGEYSLYRPERNIDGLFLHGWKILAPRKLLRK